MQVNQKLGSFCSPIIIADNRFFAADKIQKVALEFGAWADKY